MKNDAVASKQTSLKYTANIGLTGCWVALEMCQQRNARVKPHSATSS